MRVVKVRQGNNLLLRIFMRLIWQREKIPIRLIINIELDTNWQRHFILRKKCVDVLLYNCECKNMQRNNKIIGGKFNGNSKAITVI